MGFFELFKDQIAVDLIKGFLPILGIFFGGFSFIVKQLVFNPLVDLKIELRKTREDMGKINDRFSKELSSLNSRINELTRELGFLDKRLDLIELKNHKGVDNEHGQ